MHHHHIPQISTAVPTTLSCTGRLWGGLVLGSMMLGCSMVTLAAPAPILGLQSQDRIQGEYIVVLKNDLADAKNASANAQKIATANGYGIKRQFQGAFNGFAVGANPAAVSQTATDAMLNAMANNPQIAFIEANQQVSLHQTPPNARLDAVQSPLSFSEWGLDRIDQPSLPLNNSYAANATGLGVHAYIVDTGINVAHVEFSGRLGLGENFQPDGRGINDCHGHGTHVAGTIGGKRFGVAKEVTLHPVRVLDCAGSGSSEQIIAGLDWIANNHLKPAVTNMSLGFRGEVASVDLAIKNLINKGVTVVASAGNSSVDTCAITPGRVPEAITVGSTNSDDTRSFFTNVGLCNDLFAPGSAITSAWIPTASDTSTLSGTSMAAPHVAGVAAIFLERNPSAAPAVVADALIAASTKDAVIDPLGSPNRLLNVNVVPASDWRRTLVFIEGQTQTGQDMFIRGGIDHTFARNNLGLNCDLDKFKCAMPIRHLNFRNGTTAPWKNNDNFLDWHGPELFQSRAAQGSPLDWTINFWPNHWGQKRTVAVDGFGETPLNRWGAHYWMLDIEMDCSQTVSGGWFELKSFISNGPGWEGDVRQPGAPYISGNHFAQCGKLNVFRRSQSNPVTIQNIP